MPNDAVTNTNLDQQLAQNSTRIQGLVDQQYNVEITRSVELFFSSPEEKSARSILKALFAKGTRVLSRDPEAKDDGRFHIRVGVKRSLRDTVREDFTRDMVDTVSGMNGTYDGWNLLTDDAAEDIQRHADAQVA